eukprot:6509001-Prymnesium_polylepis.1
MVHIHQARAVGQARVALGVGCERRRVVRPPRSLGAERYGIKAPTISTTPICCVRGTNVARSSWGTSAEP